MQAFVTSACPSTHCRVQCLHIHRTINAHASIRGAGLLVAKAGKIVAIEHTIGLHILWSVDSIAQTQWYAIPTQPRPVKFLTPDARYPPTPFESLSSRPIVSVAAVVWTQLPVNVDGRQPFRSTCVCLMQMWWNKYDDCGKGFRLFRSNFMIQGNSDFELTSCCSIPMANSKWVDFLLLVLVPCNGFVPPLFIQSRSFS